jgi:hypothetical protein
MVTAGVDVGAEQKGFHIVILEHSHPIGFGKERLEA